MKRTRTGLLLMLCAGLLAAPAAAQAQFAPYLDVSLAPAAPASESALTATIAQPATDSAIQRFTLNLPAGFQPTGAPGAAACPLAAILAFRCPDSTRIGGVEAVAGARVGFSGSVHKTSPTKFVVFVSGLGGAISQIVPGSLTRRPNGSLDLKLDQLPALGVSRFTISFAGGGRALVRTPPACGTYIVDGKFTSRLQELALARNLVAISDCAGAAAVNLTGIRLAGRRFRARGFSTVLRWNASRATGSTAIRFERRVRRRWREVGRLIGMGRAGANLIRWDGRVRGRRLKPGVYRLRIQPQGSTPSRAVRFRVVRR